VIRSHERWSRLWSSVARYGLAVVATLIAFAITVAISRERPTPIFLVFVLAVALSSWYGGRGPSVLAAILAVVLAKYQFKEPMGTLGVNDLDDLIPFIVFLVVALVISLTIEGLLRARALAELRAAEIERMNEGLRHVLVSRRLLTAEETERRRIARVLHEDVGQLLTAVRLNLQRLTSEDHGGDDPVVRDSIGLIDETVARVRELSGELRPALLDDLGLGQAVEWYANRQAGRAGYAIAVDERLGEGRLPEPVETAGFRIVQQALTNIARHAQAKTVQIQLRRDPKSVELAVIDDGIGFDVGDARMRAQAGESLGLVHMMELAYMAGGIIIITSAKGSGSTVRVSFPLNSVE
jgi:signal transduction histidine kinase